MDSSSTPTPTTKICFKGFPDPGCSDCSPGGTTVGHIVAAACLFGEDSAPTVAESMFPMM
jgi:hypothetical protein